MTFYFANSEIINIVILSFLAVIFQYQISIEVQTNENSLILVSTEVKVMEI